MKKINKLAALLLVLVMAMSLCACGDGAKKLYGTWSTQFDLTEALAEEMSDEFADFDEELIVTVYVDFNEDKTYEMYVDHDRFCESMDGWINAFVDFSVEMMYTMMEEQGVDRATADELLEQQFGMPIAEYMLQAMLESMDTENLAEEMQDAGVFDVKGDKIYMAAEEVDKNAYDVFTIKDGVMTIDMAEGAQVPDAFESVAGIEYPLTFTKVQ